MVVLPSQPPNAESNDSQAEKEAIGKLAEMIQRPQDERFKLLRMIKYSLKSDAQAPPVHKNLRERIEELRSTTENIIDLIDESLVRRIRKTNPEASPTLEKTQKMLNERLGE